MWRLQIVCLQDSACKQLVAKQRQGCAQKGHTRHIAASLYCAVHTKLIEKWLHALARYATYNHRQLMLTCICGMKVTVNKNYVAHIDASCMHVLLGQLSEQDVRIDSLFL